MAQNKIEKRVEKLLSAEHFDDYHIEQLLALGSDAIEYLKRFATGSHLSNDPTIQARAILACGYTGYEECLPVLDKVLQQNPDEGMRLRAMKAQGQIGGQQAIINLHDYVNRNDCSAVECVWAIRALGDIDDENARQAIETIGEKYNSYSLVQEEYENAKARYSN